MRVVVAEAPLWGWNTMRSRTRREWVRRTARVAALNVQRSITVPAAAAFAEAVHTCPDAVEPRSRTPVSEMTPPEFTRTSVVIEVPGLTFALVIDTSAFGVEGPSLEGMPLTVIAFEGADPSPIQLDALATHV